MFRITQYHICQQLRTKGLLVLFVIELIDKCFLYFLVAQIPVTFDWKWDKIISNPTKDALILLDGESNTLYKMDCVNDGCLWDEMPQKLKLKRSRATIMLIPDSLANCN